MFSKLIRLGRDAELQTTPSGKQVCKIVGAYDVGWGDNKKTVWVEGSLWGDRSQKLAQHLTKGSQLVIHGDDVEPNAYQKKDGSGIATSLRMTVISVELVARAQQDQQSQSQGYQQPAQYQAPASPYQQVPNGNQYQPGGFDEDPDIPF